MDVLRLISFLKRLTIFFRMMAEMALYLLYREFANSSLDLRIEADKFLSMSFTYATTPLKRVVCKIINQFIIFHFGKKFKNKKIDRFFLLQARDYTPDLL